MASSGYVAWSVVAGEQPTATKWNLLGSNDSSFNTGNGFNDNTIVSRHLASGLSVANIESNPYKFRYYRAAAANTGNGTGATVIWDTKLYDTGSNYSISTGNFTCPISGFYFFVFQVAGNTSGASQTILSSLWQNGVLQAQGNRSLSPSAAFIASNGSMLLQCTAGDTVQVQAFGTTTFALSVNSIYDMYFTGFLVSAT